MTTNQRPAPVINLNIKKNQIKLKSERDAKSNPASNKLRVKILHKDADGT